MKSFLITTGIIALLGFGLLMADVKTDYNHHVNFGAFKTYSWIEVDAGNSLWSDRIQRDVDRQLTAKGLTRVPSGGDMAVAAMGRTREQQSYTTFYDGLGGGWFWGGLGDDAISTTSEQNIPVGTLSVDIFNPATKKLMWRSTSEKTLSKNPEKNSKKLEDAVADMFKNFPPRGES